MAIRSVFQENLEFLFYEICPCCAYSFLNENYDLFFGLAMPHDSFFVVSRTELVFSQTTTFDGKFVIGNLIRPTSFYIGLGNSAVASFSHKHLSDSLNN